MPKQELIDAAVDIVREYGAAKIAGESWATEYPEAYMVASRLVDRGLLPDVENGMTSAQKDDRRKSNDGKAKRLLDQAAALPNPPILRFSSRTTQTLPRLDGRRRSFYGNGVGYITPGLHALCEAAASAADMAAKDRREEMRALLEAAERLGLPEPTGTTNESATYGLDAFRAMIEAIEARDG
jgi:hypothetical protein